VDSQIYHKVLAGALEDEFRNWAMQRCMISSGEFVNRLRGGTPRITK